MSSSITSRIFALIIGIDTYLDKEFVGLKGAAADADDIAGYLSNRLHVPSTRIRNLRNEKATRNAIRKELLGLATNSAIKKDDPILIYFAGHGNDAAAPPEWKNWDSRVQSLVPHDYGQLDDQKCFIHGIPDRSLGTILKRLADSKGNNITVILDCCHSGSGTRSSDTLVRSSGVGRPIPANLDEDLFPTTRGSFVLPRFRNHGLDSHVLLAACTPEELAHEKAGRGAFTFALMEALYSIDVTAVTYGELMRRLGRLPIQNPQCEGNADRMLFNNNIRDMKAYHPAQFTIKKEITSILIDAGRVHGITEETTFDIWTGWDAVQGTPLARVKAETITSFKTEAKWTGSTHYTSLIAKAKDTEKPILNIYIQEAFDQAFGFLFEASSDPASQTFVLKKTPAETADVGLSIQNGTMIFKLLAQEEKHHRCPPRSVDSKDDLWGFLSNIAFYYHHLRQVKDLEQSIKKFPSQDQKAKPPKQFISMFSVEVYLLEEDDCSGELYPVGPNLNITNDVGVRLELGHDTTENIYGFKIVNSSTFDVYPHLFYFNSYDISVDAFYKPVNISNQVADHPLKRGINGNPGLLHVGWGASGTQPRSFGINDKTNVENGYLKLYIARQYADLSFIEQRSIGEVCRGSTNPPRKNRASELWGTLTIPFILERKKGEVGNQHESAMICIMGTKSAKAAFLDDLFNSSVSKTTATGSGHIETHEIMIEDGRFVTVVDLPSFETDNLEKNADLTKAILSHFREQTSSKACHGFIFAYDISKHWNRVQVVDTLNFNLLKDLCGEGYYKSVLIMTTNWDRGFNETFKERESGLRSNTRLCKGFIDHGAGLSRYDHSSISVTTISKLASRNAIPLAIQSELAVNQAMAKTGVATTLRNRVSKRMEAIRNSLDEVNQELKEARHDGLPKVEIQAMEGDKKELEAEKSRLQGVLSGLQLSPSLN